MACKTNTTVWEVLIPCNKYFLSVHNCDVTLLTYWTFLPSIILRIRSCRISELPTTRYFSITCNTSSSQQPEVQIPHPCSEFKFFTTENQQEPLPKDHPHTTINEGTWCSCYGYQRVSTCHISDGLVCLPLNQKISLNQALRYFIQDRFISRYLYFTLSQTEFETVVL